MSVNASVEFFDRQFGQQVARCDLALNPFEAAVLPYLRGSVLDFGCGLGNLAIRAARDGHAVLALDASRTAIEHIARIAHDEALPLTAVLADLSDFTEPHAADTVVCIGLLMFFDCPTAYRQLDYLKAQVKHGGVAAVNVLTEGTTYVEMFVPGGHCLFKPDELVRRFADWEILLDQASTFPASDGAQKVFSTVIARRPVVTAVRADASRIDES